MHVSHVLDAFKDAMKSEFVDHIFFNFCVGVELEFQKF